MTRRFVSYVPIPYGMREGTSKVRLMRDSLRTLEYIVLAATYYDPLKLFALLSVICIILSLAGFGISFLFGIKGGYILGLGGLLVALMIFSTGLLASLLKQIMDKGRASGVANRTHNPWGNPWLNTTRGRFVPFMIRARISPDDSGPRRRGP